MGDLVNVFIEIEQGSNIKYEYNHETAQLQVDRVLTPPFVYPYAYGFIPFTLADDGDEMDALIISDEPHEIGTTQVCRIVGVLIMEDEGGMDEKVLVVPSTNTSVQDVYDLDSSVTESIQTFFATYKQSAGPNKWSTVHGIKSKEAAIELYGTYLTKWM